MRRLAALFVVLLAAMPASAETDLERAAVASATRALDEAQRSLSRMSGPTGSQICEGVLRSRSGRQPRGAQAACARAYSRFYQRDVVDIRVAMGYQDGRPNTVVVDQFIHAAMMDHLIRKPCPANYFACGFSTTDDGDVIEKPVMGLDGRERIVRLRLTRSSVGTNDDTNRANPEQGRQSARSRRNFLEGLSDADAVFYMGHSRNGSGPDFNPPNLDSHGHTDYERYRSEHAGLDQMIEALQASPRRPALIGLVSCSSRGHFGPRVTAAAPDSGLLATGDTISMRQGFKSTMGSLNSLLGMRCQGDFARSIAAPSDGRPSLTGFF